MPKLFLLVLSLCWLALAGATLAESTFDAVTDVRQTMKGETLHLVIETERSEPQVSAYFTSRPDRFVVELNNALPKTRLPRRPSSQLVKNWSLKKSGLNRARLSLNLRQQPGDSTIEMKTYKSPPRVELDISARTGVKDEVALTEGITWYREDTFLGGRWTRLNRLLFDPEDPNVEVVVGLAKEQTNKREKLTTMISRYKAIAGINGGFFAGGGGALGLVFRDGRMLAPHVGRRPPRSGFGLTKSGRPLFGRLAAVGSRIKDLDGGDWSDAWLALGGGPRLIKAGKTKITADLEELGPKGNDITRVAARTVVGLNEAGKLMFATVTGYRDNHREGTKFGPLVGWLKRLKVKEAVNFDGGASVNMVIGSHIVSDGPANKTKEKPVATALLVKDKRKKLYPHKARWKVERKILPADGASTSSVEVSLTTPSGAPVPDGTPVRFFCSGAMTEPSVTESENGRVRTEVKSVRRPGKAKLTLLAGPLTEHKTLTLRGGETRAMMVAQLDAQASEEEDFQEVRLRVQATDEWGNGVKRERFTCSVDGGEPIDFKTDGIGLMDLDVELPLKGGSFKVSHPNCQDVTHHIPPLDSDTP